MTGQMKLIKLLVGYLSTNCYIYYNTESGAAVVVDPGGEPEKIKRAVSSFDGEVEAVLLTHAHTDHVLAAGELKKYWPDLAMVMSADEEEILDLPSDIVPGVPREMIGTPDRYVKDGDVLTYAGCTLTVLATPGHTKGSVCFYDKENAVLFSGDTLFRGSCGRVDLPGGNGREMFASLTRLKKEIPDDVQVLPGHMSASMMGTEKRTNPYLLQV